MNITALPARTVHPDCAARTHVQAVLAHGGPAYLRSPSGDRLGVLWVLPSEYGKTRGQLYPDVTVTQGGQRGRAATALRRGGAGRGRGSDLKLWLTLPDDAHVPSGTDNTHALDSVHTSVDEPST